VTTLKEKISAKLDYNEQEINRKMSRIIIDGPRPRGTTQLALEISRTICLWNHNDLKNEVLPILLECVEALEKVSLKKTMIVYSHSEEFMNGANTAFCQASEISDEALERLRKWSESDK